MLALTLPEIARWLIFQGFKIFAVANLIET